MDVFHWIMAVACGVLVAILVQSRERVKSLGKWLSDTQDLLEDRLNGAAGQISAGRRDISQLSNALLERQNELKGVRDRLLDVESRLELIADETKFWVDDSMELRWGPRPVVEEGVDDCA